MKKLKIAAIAVGVLVAAALSGRLIARMSAAKYGQNVRDATMMLGIAGFADTKVLRKYLAGPEMTYPLNRVHALSFLGGDYSTRTAELQQGLIYLSEQMNLPPEQRFSRPPELKHLKLTTSDPTNDGMRNSLLELLASFESQL